MSTTKKTLAVAGAVAAALTAVTAPHASAQAKENATASLLQATMTAPPVPARPAQVLRPLIIKATHGPSLTQAPAPIWTCLQWQTARRATALWSRWSATCPHNPLRYISVGAHNRALATCSVLIDTTVSLPSLHRKEVRHARTFRAFSPAERRRCRL